MMKLVRWTRFTWDLANLPAEGATIAGQYAIRPLGRDEERAARAVIISSFALDISWSDALKTMRDWLDAQIDETFSHKAVPCLVVTHGTRIIGASTLCLDPEALVQLGSGPCILSEYRNRGIGTELLYRSLAVLRDHGVERANAVTKANVPGAKFVYPKFGATSEPFDFDMLLATMPAGVQRRPPPSLGVTVMQP